MHQVVPKGWGHEVVVVNTPEYCGKLLHVAAGKKCSWHYHQKKDETFWLSSGRLFIRWVALEDALWLKEHGRDEASAIVNGYLVHQKELVQGQSFRVPVGMRHQFEAITDCVLVEFSTHHEDSDSIRVVHGD